MLRSSHLLASLGIAAVGLGLQAVSFCALPFDHAPVCAGPESMAEVMRIVAERGLYCRSDRHDGIVTTRLLVSDRPLTLTQANLIRFGAPEHPCWQRTVAVCYPGKHYVANYDPDYSAFWGRTFLYGDPELIDRLMGVE
jgi:hypothetical protein